MYHCNSSFQQCNSAFTGGLNHLFRRIIFSFYGNGNWFLMKCILFLLSEEIIVIGYNLVSFLHNFMENISGWTKINVLFNNEHLILIIFLIDWQWIWFKKYFKNIESIKSSRISIKIRKILLFSKSFSVFISCHP